MLAMAHANRGRVVPAASGADDEHGLISAQPANAKDELKAVLGAYYPEVKPPSPLRMSPTFEAPAFCQSLRCVAPEETGGGATRARDAAAAASFLAFL